MHHNPEWPVGKGDRIRVNSGGGGGWGPAAERRPAAVLADVADGLISPDRAKADYGIDVKADAT